MNNNLDKENFNINGMQPIQISDGLDENNSQENLIDIEKDNVIPISDVKLEEKEATIKNKNLPQSEKHPKLTMIFLFIFFLLMFIYIMAMPYIDEWLNRTKDKENKGANDVETNEPINNKNNSVEKLSVLTCSLEIDTTQTVEEIFKYNKNNEVLNSSITEKWLFTNRDDNYVNLSNRCNENLNLIGKDGISLSCIIDEFEIIISREFDLELFKPITLENETINSNSSYKQNINEIKSRLLSEGYNCQ